MVLGEGREMREGFCIAGGKEAMELHLNYTLLESSMVSSKAHLPEERLEHRVVRTERSTFELTLQERKRALPHQPLLFLYKGGK